MFFLKCCSTDVDSIKTTSPRMEEGLADRTSLAPQQQQLVQPGGYFCYGGATGEKTTEGFLGKFLPFGRLLSD